MDRPPRFLDADTVLTTHGIWPHEHLVRHDLHTVEAADTAAEELLGLPSELAPSALFAAQNLITIGTIHALHRHGLQHQVALVGVDDLPLADLLDPGITVVAQDPYAIGTAAAELIIRGSGEIRPRPPLTFA